MTLESADIDALVAELLDEVMDGIARYLEAHARMDEHDRRR